ncbi:MAG: hypothetical protein GDA48_05115 [Hormoscilla sp. GM102CHS1]|nr:hypothetical protein [Hormoscilla sp. GM102CHS1]
METRCDRICYCYHKQKYTASNTLVWILVVESKNSAAAESTGLSQLLTDAFQSLESQASVWGLTTNGRTYQFVYIQQGNPPTYQFMPILDFFAGDLLGTAEKSHPATAASSEGDLLAGRGRTGGHPPILPFETGLAIFTAGGYWLV